MKSASNELVALNAVVSSNIKYLHVPFVVVITTLGHRISCISHLPIEDKKTHVYVILI